MIEKYTKNINFTHMHIQINTYIHTCMYVCWMDLINNLLTSKQQQQQEQQKILVVSFTNETD